MRKRCFIIAILAAFCGGVLLALELNSRVLSVEEKRELVRENLLIEVKAKQEALPSFHSDQAELFFDEAIIRARVEGFDEDRLDSLVDAFQEGGPDSGLSGTMLASYASLGLAGVLFLVGFIIGPPKKAS